jgi:hypothetical protein
LQEAEQILVVDGFLAVGKYTMLKPARDGGTFERQAKGRTYDERG